MCEVAAVSGNQTLASSDTIIEGGDGAGFILRPDQHVEIVNLEGSQVVDAWAFAWPALDDWLSTAHTRSCLEKLTPGVGDSLYSCNRYPLLTVVEDTSPGVHDLLLSACDERRYELLGCKGYHRNCADNFAAVFDSFDRAAPPLPNPFNVFENVAIGTDGELTIKPPVVAAGQSIRFRVHCELLLILSACPMDIAATNGVDGRVRPVRVNISD